MLAPTIGTVRPHMFTTLGFSLTLILIRKAESGHYRPLWMLPLIFAAWPNLHGGFLAGGGMVALWALFHLFGHYRQWRGFLPPLILSACATLLNPYGINLILFLLRTATVPRPEITEWAPLALISITGASYLALLIISVLGLVYSRRPRHNTLIWLFGAAALLPFLATRHTNLFTVTALVFAGEHAADAWTRLFKRQSKALAPARPAVAVLPALAAAALLFNSVSFAARIEVDTKFYPVTATAILKKSQAVGNLATSFNWGEYVLWHAGPNIKVMMDGRRETIYPQEIYNQYINFHHGRKEWDALLKKFPAEIALVEMESAHYNLLALKPEWRLVYKDKASALFVKNDSRWLEPIRKAAEGAKPPADNLNFP